MNLAGEDLTQVEFAGLSRQYEVQIWDCWRVDAALSKALAGDFCRLHTSILYLLPESCEIDRSDHWWSYSFRQHDAVVWRA